MSQQYVIFKLNDEHFAVEIARVLEIILTQTVFKVPNAPEFIDGLINLRGKVYTLFNLRKKFNLPPSNINDEDSKVLIVNVNSMYIGMSVDSVDEIIQFEDDAIESTPAHLDKKYISGVAKVNDKLILLLDLESLTESSNECIYQKAAK
ncbi:chemotaxis protein CheW [Acetivibrio cellulolyticus]|uniref:chemotaxis protein CheW n=1 Tax=Acetivibrio cellulolyticus TaxID=35830 RepID=UPI0001E2E761|nr:chemotaxis protein CheW [Acetivibrio cellulolyticus]